MEITKEMIQNWMEKGHGTLPKDTVTMDVYSTLNQEQRQFVNIYLKVDAYIIYFEPVRSGVSGIDDSSARKLLKTLIADFSVENVKRVLSSIAYNSATAYKDHNDIEFCEDIIRIFISTDDIARVNDKSEIYNLFADVIGIATGLNRSSIDHAIIDVCTDFLADDDFPKEWEYLKYIKTKNWRIKWKI